MTAFEARALDLNGDGMSDVWQRVYQAEDMAPEDDADGDGLTNREESWAGTDPCEARMMATHFGDGDPNTDAGERRRPTTSPVGLVVYTPAATLGQNEIRP